MSDTTTEGIRIRVRSRLVPERSDTAQGKFFFTYTITVENVGDERAQLISRHWVITDGTGEVREVRGPGVIGKQPSLAPGASFEYSSFCPLTTPVGTMEGSFQMVREDGREFDAEIAPFTLAAPYALN